MYVYLGLQKNLLCSIMISEKLICDQLAFAERQELLRQTKGFTVI